MPPAKFIFRRFPLRISVWVTFGSNGKCAEFSIGKSSENAKNPDEIRRFQPDLVGVSGFEPEASWSRRLVGYFSRTFQGISAPFRSENFTAASFPARINPPDFSAFGSRFGSKRDFKNMVELFDCKMQEKAPKSSDFGVFYGGQYRTRTCDPMHVKHVLIPAELTVHQRDYYSESRWICQALFSRYHAIRRSAASP